MIARLTTIYLAIFAAVLALLSGGAYVFLAAQYHSLLLPALSTPEGQNAYHAILVRLITTIVAFDLPLLIIVGVASALLARLSIRPLLLARERERAFVADAAHELRSPLATIASVAQATRGAANDETVREGLGLIIKTSLDASALIGDLLTLAREPAGTLLAREPVDVAAITRECLRELAPRATAAKIDVHDHLSSAIIDGDERRLRELLRNLFDNALRHARTTIDVACVGADGFATLTVSDDGHGVASELRERIFDRFVRGGDAAAGSGLGLSIAQWIVHAHNGSITVAPGGTSGATFVVKLPLLRT